MVEKVEESKIHHVTSCVQLDRGGYVCHRALLMNEPPLTKLGRPAVDPTGERYDNIEVLSVSYRTRKKCYVKVRCWCEEHNGSILPTDKELFTIRRGMRVGCNKSATDNEKGLRELWNHHKSDAKRHGHEPAIESYQDFVKIASSNCTFCGKDPEERRNRAKGYIYAYNANTIDRIDARRGYTLDNVQPLCIDCNYMKSTIDNLIKNTGQYNGADLRSVTFDVRIRLGRWALDAYEQIESKKDQDSNRTP